MGEWPPDSDTGAGQTVDGIRSKPLVFIATPMFGGMATGTYTWSMVQLSAVFFRSGVDLVYSFQWNESLVPNARNVLAAQFLESQATHLMWIDADIGFNATDIVSMLIADRDIVCGIYPRKEINWARVAAAVKAGVPVEELNNHAGSFAIKGLVGVGSGEETDPDGMFEIEAGGTGFMLIKRGVFDALAESVAEYRVERRALKEFYATTTDPGTSDLVTEDYNFCRLARSRGFKVYAAPWVRLSHTGTYVFERRFDPNWLKRGDGSGN